MYLSKVDLKITSLGFQILLGMVFLLFVVVILQIFGKRKLKKKIKALDKKLAADADEKTLLLYDKNEKHKRYESLYNENESLFNAKEENEKRIKHLEGKIAEGNAQNIQLQMELAKIKNLADNDLSTSKVIIKKREEEITKHQTTFITLQDQLKRDTQENINLGEEIKKQKQAIANQFEEIEYHKQQAVNLQEQIAKLEEDKKSVSKRKAEDDKRKQNQNKLAEMKNQVYRCFQSIDHPIFACYQSDVTRGTYLHVNQVGQLSYHAAKAIGGNPEYARASALFHDLGKTSIYKYFKENWPHNKDQKLESENVSYTFTHRGHMICSHVEKGVQIFHKLLETYTPDVNNKLAEFKLNEQEKHFVFEEAKEDMQKSILEHQAKSHVRMLYQEAINNGEICQLDDFEYMMGQIPSNKEQGIICLADSCEAAFSSNMYESEAAVSKLITDVITGRVNAGHMNNSGLTTQDIQAIRKSFTDYLIEVWKSKRPDRMEEKVEEDPESYSLHESGNDIIRKMTQRFHQGDLKQKRKALRYFMDLKNKTLNAINVEDLIIAVETNLESELDDNILITNSLVVLSAYYKHIISQMIDDINKHHPISFNLNKEKVDLELVQNSDISAYIEAKLILKHNLARLQKIRETITSAIRKHRLYESHDNYVTKWATQIDNYLSNQSNIPEVLSLMEKSDSSRQLENVVAMPEDFSHFISVKQEKIYIAVNLDLFRCDCKFIRFVVYFYDYKKNPLVDTGGMFCTKDTSQVAILQSFLIKNSKYYTIKESAVVLPQSELHVPGNYNKSMFAKIQIHGIRVDDKPFLMFDKEEEFSLDKKRQ